VAVVPGLFGRFAGALEGLWALPPKSEFDVLGLALETRVL